MFSFCDKLSFIKSILYKLEYEHGWFIYMNAFFAVPLFMNVIFLPGKFKPVIKKAMVELEGNIFMQTFMFYNQTKNSNGQLI